MHSAGFVFRFTALMERAYLASDGNFFLAEHFKPADERNQEDGLLLGDNLVCYSRQIHTLIAFLWL